MVAIRNRNTNVPHVFRYPKYEFGVFYPAGSLVSYPIESPSDSDEAYFEFYVSRYNVAADKNILPGDDAKTWKLILSSYAGDSDLQIRLEAIESVVLEHDSDLLMIYDEFKSTDSDIITELNLINYRLHELESFDSDISPNSVNDYGIF